MSGASKGKGLKICDECVMTIVVWTAVCLLFFILWIISHSRAVRCASIVGLSFLMLRATFSLTCLAT